VAKALPWLQLLANRSSVPTTEQPSHAVPHSPLTGDFFWFLTAVKEARGSVQACRGCSTRRSPPNNPLISLKSAQCRRRGSLETPGEALKPTAGQRGCHSDDCLLRLAHNCQARSKNTCVQSGVTGSGLTCRPKPDATDLAPEKDSILFCLSPTPGPICREQELLRHVRRLHQGRCPG
jgi:hypothetical protein